VDSYPESACNQSLDLGHQFDSHGAAAAVAACVEGSGAHLVLSSNSCHVRWWWRLVAATGITEIIRSAACRAHHLKNLSFISHTFVSLFNK
jgi:hypothetical protein